MTALGLQNRGRGNVALIPLEVLREVTEEDVRVLQVGQDRGGAGVTPDAPSLRILRYSHHQLAQELAKGTSLVDASFITGYTVNYIAKLKDDPTFSDLLAHYKLNRDMIFVDVLERMKSLGIHAMEELQSRLVDKPESFSHRELMELHALVMGKVVAPAGQGSAPPNNSPTNISISFVEAKPLPPARVIGATIENGE